MAEPPPASLTTGMTIASAQRAISKMLAAAGIESPQLDTRLLVAAATGETPERLLLAPQRPLSDDEALTLTRFAARRSAHEPVSRILGQREFFGRTFKVTPETLDPRPDTETLIDLALGLLRDAGPSAQAPRIADIGTGTGAILLTLLAELPSARGTGSDVSQAALAVAQENAGKLGVRERADWHLGRSLETLEGTFDLLVSNPPYIPSSEIAGLDRDVRNFDPRLALDGGADGLDIVRELVAGATYRMRPGGWCILELGAGQSGAVSQMLEKKHGNLSAAGRLRIARDLGGHERCVAWQPHI